jgi:hypothetical protein
MKAPAGMRQTHLKLLTILLHTGKSNYSSFREENNPWRCESYFDSQIKWLVNKGLVVLEQKTIMVTNSGAELVRSCGNGV